MTVDPEAVLRLLLVFVRAGALLVAAPFFGRPFVPVPVKVMLTALLAFAFAGLVPAPVPAAFFTPLGFSAAVAIEALTGLLLGFGARFAFFAVEVAGAAIGFQMSLGLAQAYNPVSGSEDNPVGRLLAMGFLLFFVLLDGPHHLVRALAGSFEVVPLGGANLAAGGELLLGWTGAFFATALRLAAPFIVTMLLLDVALGIFARVVPQADLFAISLPAKLLVGLGLTWVFLQGFVSLAPGLLDGMLSDLAALVGALAP